jgi:hypothetical protein
MAIAIENAALATVFLVRRSIRFLVSDCVRRATHRAREAGHETFLTASRGGCRIGSFGGRADGAAARAGKEGKRALFLATAGRKLV